VPTGAELLHRGRAHDGRRAGREDGQEGGARLLEDELDGRGIDDLDRLDVAEEEVRERILAQLVERVLRVDLPLDGELHRLRVERRAVVEGDVLPELERVAQAVLRYRPGLGQPRHHLRALVGEGHQRLDDAPADPVRVEVGHLGGVEVHGLGDESHDQRAGRLGGDGRRDEADAEDDGEEQGRQQHHRRPPVRGVWCATTGV
jgi:hypothetical protein